MTLNELTFYSVTSEGVITVPDIPEPKSRAEVFEQVDLRDVHSRQDLITLIKNCHPLTRHFQNLSMAYLESHSPSSSFVDNLLAQRSQRSGAQKLILGILRRDPDDGWQQWIAYSGDAALEGFLQIVRDWRESEYFDAIWNGQAAALAYFDDLPHAILKVLGVRIIDGDVPGSTYRAAELAKDMDQANQIAQLLELDVRFEKVNAPVEVVRHD